MGVRDPPLAILCGGLLRVEYGMDARTLVGASGPNGKKGMLAERVGIVSRWQEVENWGI